MTDWLHSHGFSYKKPKPQPSKADPEKQSEFVKDYHKSYSRAPKIHIILDNGPYNVSKKIIDLFDYTWDEIAPQLTSRINDNFETILSAV